MLELFLKLVDKSIQLLRERKKHRAQLLREYVDPIYADFVALHEHYLSSFREYRSFLERSGDSPSEIKKLAEKLYQDNLFSRHELERLKLLSSELESTRGDLGNSESLDLEFLVYAIRSYIDTSSYISHDDGDELRRDLEIRSSVSQVWRNSLRGHLEEKLANVERYEGQLKAEALFVLDEVILEMQRRYSDVTGSYLQVKSNLIQLG